MTDRTITCETLDELLPDLLEETLDPSSRAAAEQHAAACERCSALLGDLEVIRVEARALPALRPSRDLWEGISARIEAPVIPLEPARTPLAEPAPLASRPARAPLQIRRRWLAAAAAALVMGTAGITRWLSQPGVPSGEIAQQPPIADTGKTMTVAATDAPPAPVAVPADSAVQAAIESAGRRTRATPVAGTPGAGQAAATYDREIARLDRILAERSQDLDPKTVAILEQSMKVIDEAIAQSRAALARDPRSSFLGKQLNSALDRKVELLRTAVLLPSST